MIDIKEVQAEAEKEVREEKMKAAKTKIKRLIKQVDDSKQILANAERELADAYAEIGAGNFT